MNHRMVVRVVLSLVAVSLAGVIGACNQTSVFADRDSVVDRKLRYYDNDSARAASEARRKGGEGGFGFPGGAGPQ